MAKNSILTFLVLSILLMPGCLNIVDDIISDIEDSTDDYPSLALGERARASPALQTYDACSDLLEDLQDSAFEEALVSLDQNAYWHWTDSYYYALREGDVMMDGFAEMASDDMAIDSSAPTAVAVDSDSGNSAPVEGEDYSGTNNQ